MATEADVKDPAHWAVHLTEDYAYFDRETGEQVDTDTVDDDTRDDESLEADEGLRHYNTVEERTVFVSEWYCLDPQAAGLTPSPSLRGRGGASVGGGATEDDPEAEARRQEAERHERRKRPMTPNARAPETTTSTESPSTAASRYQQLRSHLAELKLHAAAEAVLDQATAEGLSLTVALERLLTAEVDASTTRRLAGRLRFACLPTPATLADFDVDAAAGIDRPLIEEPSICRYLESATNILLIGPPATALPSKDGGPHSCASLAGPGL